MLLSGGTFRKKTATHETVPPLEYEVKSKEIARLWNLFSNTGQELDKIILEARTILENSGYSRTEAMKKIAEDHKHLRGFSLPNLYRMLPKEDKQYQASKIRIVEGEDQLEKDSHFENDSEQTEVDDERRIEIMKQLPKEVVEYADKIDGGLSTNKLELLTNKRLKKYPELQKHMIEKITDKEKITDEIKVTDNKARDIVHQTINDLETGYLRPSETGEVFTYGHPLKRDIISKKEAKDPYEYYRDLLTPLNKLLYLLTAYKKDEHEYYTKDIVNNSHNHRLDIAKSINSEYRELYGFYEYFVKPAKMALEDIYHILK